MRSTAAIVALAFLFACGGSSSTEADSGARATDATDVIDAADASEDSYIEAVDGGADAALEVDAGDSASELPSEASSIVDAAEAGAACTRVSGCATGVCAYLIADSCSAVGTCVARPAPLPCKAVCSESLCGCDGSMVSFAACCEPALPEGYAPAPVKPADDAGMCN